MSSDGTQDDPYNLKNVLDASGARRLARAIRFSVISNLYREGELTKDAAMDLLNGPLEPGNDLSWANDAELLDDPDAMSKIKGF
jgi:hypothetical protein